MSTGLDSTGSGDDLRGEHRSKSSPSVSRLRAHRDGPALRALTLIPYANFLLDRGHSSDLEYIRNVLYKKDQLRAEGSVIKNDLEEVASTWWAEGFDLWEEV